MKNATLQLTVRHILRASAFAAFVGVSAEAGSAQLPVPCLPGSCGPSGPQFVTSGAAKAVQAGNSLTVQQSSAQAILNWTSFNVSADGKVLFQQPTATSIALNRIFDARPSTILGSVSANGQIYLINPNGIVFGRGAQVNVSGLIASSLGISDATFAGGLLSPQLLINHTAALTSDPQVVQANGNPQLDSNGNPVLGAVTVAAGAQITANSGRVLLAAPTVQNAGSIQAPDGQIVLAAGQKVYLQASQSPDLRGLVVEVDAGGTAWNQLTGALSAARGNVTLVGLAVNQDGRISATTTVASNGSVRLEASDTTTAFPTSVTGATGQIESSHGGTLELGPQSSTSVQPELNDSTTAVDAQPQLPSTVTMLGQQVFVHGGSITAPGGQLEVIAAANPGAGLQSVVGQGNTEARIRIDAGTTIDLSGSTAELPMSANEVAVQLRANELADDPTQRNGALRGQTVIVDTRVGTPIANVQDAIAAIPKSIAQRTEAGGTATFASEGDVVFAQGATLNVSGGETKYDAGVIQTSLLVGTNGQLYDIGTASPLITYSGVLNPTFTQTFNKWGVTIVAPTPGIGHFEPGYVQGAPAGQVDFAAPALLLNGTLLGHAVNGPYQLSNSTRVPGGQLILGVPGGLPSNPSATDFLSPPVVFANQPVTTEVSDDAALPPFALHLPVAYLVGGGFTSTAIYDNLSVTVPAETPLTLTPGSTLSVTAPRIDVFSGITDVGGTVRLQTAQTVDAAQAGSGRSGIQLGDAVVVDVRGQWTNDSTVPGGTGPLQPTLQNGGTIDLALTTVGGELILGDNVALRASGGAWLNARNVVTGGSGGVISVGAGPAGSALAVGEGVTLDAFGVGTASGGTLNLSAPRLQVSPGSAGWTVAQRLDDSSSPGGTFKVLTPLFSEFGFSSVNLSASGLLTSPASPADALTVDTGADITALTRTLQLTPGYLSRPSGGTIGEFAQVITLPQANRPPASVSLSVVPQGEPTGFVLTPGVNNVGLLDVQKGASLSADPGAQISLGGVGGLSVDGKVRAPSGTITLQTLTPTDQNLDPGFVADLDLKLGPDAVLDVSGTSALQPNNAGLLLGSVLPGGSVNLFADRGSVLTQAGSLINIAGASAPLDVQTGVGTGQYARYLVASAGGALTVRAPESIAILGNLQAAAGAGDLGRPAAGALDIDLTRSQSWFSAPGAIIGSFPTTPREIQVVSGNASSQLTNGLAVLDAHRLLGSGIDSLQLQSGDGQSTDSSSIEIATGLPIDLVRQISLDAPVISVADGTKASLSAAYVSLGNSVGLAGPTSATAGTGTLSVAAHQIDLIGSTVLDGTRAATLTSSGDLLLRGANIGAAQFVGAVATAGDLTLDAARIYPATSTAFTLSSSAAGGTIAVGQTAASPGTPLSVAGSIAISADNIVSTGTLIAPFGSIDLQAVKSLTLGNGSVTSVSGDGTVLPYGNTQFGGTQWVYTSQVSQLPQRQVTLQGANVSVAANAAIDLRGGGDLYAYEWVPGTGGTRDALATGVIPGLYAILPSSAGQYASYDPLLWAGFPLSVGASVYLSGGAGLPAGVYTLLPPRYGLLPGARLIEMQSGLQTIAPGQITTLPDGTPVVAGYLTFGNTGLHAAEYSGFAVFPSSYARAVAGYQDTFASVFFDTSGSGSPLPADAGRLSLDIGSSLALAGHVLSAAAPGGHAAEIDVSATSLAVTGPGQAAPADAVALPASVLQGWGAGELVLGGHPSPDNSAISVTATNVVVGPGVRLSADQLVLVANESVDVQSGALLTTTSANGGASVSPPRSLDVTLSGTSPEPALLALSDQSLFLAQRASPSPGSTGGSVALESGSQLGTRGALSIDAPGGSTLAGALQIAGGTVSLASSSIGLLGGAPSSDALIVDSATLAELQTAQNVRLASQGPIDVYAPLALGITNGATNPSLTTLTLIGSVLNSHSAGDVGFGADTLTVQGTGTSASIPSGGAGTLTLAAGELDFGPGTFALNGFGNTAVLARGAVVGQGSGALVNAGDMSITASALTAAAGSQSSLSTTGTLLIAAPSKASSVPTDVGGALTLTASRIDDNGTIQLPGGLVSLRASGDLSLGLSASVDAAGTIVHVLDQSVAAAAGSVNLSAGGNLSLAAGSRIDVSGVGSASAGSIVLESGGAADLRSTLLGGASAGAVGGSLAVNAGRLDTGLDTLSAVLQSGGFTHQIAFRVQSGDLTLSPGSTLSASNVDLTADSGVVRVGGSIVAPSAGQRGQIALFGGGGVILASGGQLHADGSAANSRAGDIELGTGSTGTVELDSGSIVSATGSGGDGTLLLRAPATSSGDIQVTELNSNLSGVGQIVVEPVLQTSISSAPTLDDFNAIQTAVGNYAAGAETTIPARLNPTGTLPLVVRPGVELLATGDVALNNALDLGTWRFDGQPVDLTLRAPGNISVNSTISDGFTAATTALFTPTVVLSEGPSSSIRLIAGADLQSPNPLAVAPATPSDLMLEPGAVVRTGTGELDLVAAQDVVISSGASAYTAGLPAVPAQNVARTNSVFNFAEEGGALIVSAGRDVLGADVSQSVAQWQLRQGNTTRNVPAQWGVDLNQFGWNLGTLGGGDLTVVAARNINDISAAATDNRIANADGSSTMILGGGVVIAAGGDVGSGQFYAADGTARLTAGGGFTAIRPVSSTSGATSYVGSLIALNDAQVSVQARLDIDIDAVVNPTTLSPPPPPPAVRPLLLSGYFTYGSDSSLTVESTAGSVTMANNATNLVALMGLSAATGFGGPVQAYPGTFIARSLQQDITFTGGGAALFPTDHGQLELLAGRDIVDNGVLITMSDAFANSLPTQAAPVGVVSSPLLVPFASGRHASDPLPALITAGRDITSLMISVPKQTHIGAGRDISNLTLYGQNLNPTDDTVIFAGHDFVDTLQSTSAVVQLGGPGRLDVLAGRNVDLGFSEGITTIGNFANANLPTPAGADLTVMSGLGHAPDYEAFVAKVIEPSATYQQQLVEYVEGLTGEQLTFEQAVSAFAKLNTDEQRAFIDPIFFDELVASGREANTVPGAGFQRGYASIDALFPDSRTSTLPAGKTDPFQGDLNLTFSRIYTTAGGTISLFTPGGGVDVGLANPPIGVPQRLPSQLGIVTQGAGDVDIYSKGDVLVNASRIFTLGGGNILIWSNEGSIDAGRGAKSSISAPPPQVVFDAQGNVTLDLSGAVAGSGIRTIQIDPNVPAGNVDLIAPQGTVNAGDAGIGAAGNINIAAQQVIGLDNIQFGGTSTGVPAQVSNIGATLSGVSATAASATNSATESAAAGTSAQETAAPLSEVAMSWLEVFVTGLGEENCKPEDLECLKRQKGADNPAK